MRGLVGNKGEDGVPGKNGEMGLPGIKGMEGDVGLPGDVGLNGKPGRIGQRGRDGSKGLKGAPGRFGVDGSAGPIGVKVRHRELFYYANQGCSTCFTTFLLLTESPFTKICLCISNASWLLCFRVSLVKLEIQDFVEGQA